MLQSSLAWILPFWMVKKHLQDRDSMSVFGSMSRRFTVVVFQKLKENTLRFTKTQKLYIYIYIYCMHIYFIYVYFTVVYLETLFF